MNFKNYKQYIIFGHYNYYVCEEHNSMLTGITVNDQILYTFYNF
jgi:hypothetical protein